jgi:glycosidase
MVWPELSYAPEAVLPEGGPRPVADPVAFDHDLHEHYRRLIHLRNSSPALQVGEFITRLTDDASGVYAYERRHATERVIVVLNVGALTADVAVQVGAAGVWNDVLSGVTITTSDGALGVELDAGEGKVLRRVS